MQHRREAVAAIRAARLPSFEAAQAFGAGISIPGVVVSVRQDNDLGQYIFTFQGPGTNTETIQTPIARDGQPGPVQQPSGDAPGAGGGGIAGGDQRPLDEQNNDLVAPGGSVVGAGPSGNQAMGGETVIGPDQFTTMTDDELLDYLETAEVEVPDDSQREDLERLAREHAATAQ